MTLKRMHEFAPDMVDHTLWSAKQLMAEEIAMGKNPFEWVSFFAMIAEKYGIL